MDIESALECFEFYAQQGDDDGSYWSDENDKDKHTTRDAMNEVLAELGRLTRSRDRLHDLGSEMVKIIRPHFPGAADIFAKNIDAALAEEEGSRER